MKFTYERFEKEKHLDFLESCMAKRSLPMGDITFLPPTGIVVRLDDEPICLGFQTRCDNRTAINSDLVSDPDFTKVERNAAVEFLRDILNRAAEAAGFQFVSVFTSIPNHAARLKKLGYTEIDKNLTQLGRFLWL